MGETLRIEFEMADAQGGLPGWPHTVALKLLVVLDEALTLQLTSRNLGDSPVAISQALHNYFAVSDVRQAKVDGVEGLAYIETLPTGNSAPTGRAGVYPARRTGSIWIRPPTLSIVDPAWGRRIILTSSGSRSAVIWNPWTARAKELPDMADDGWQRMLCIETANVWDDVVQLQPGASCSLGVRIDCEVTPQA
ncbi:hypothetical protein GTA26_28880 [Rhodococcus hoagii]|nr:hypothetical protein [Prescottella equi]